MCTKEIINQYLREDIIGTQLIAKIIFAILYTGYLPLILIQLFRYKHETFSFLSLKDNLMNFHLFNSFTIFSVIFTSNSQRQLNQKAFGVTDYHQPACEFK